MTEARPWETRLRRAEFHLSILRQETAEYLDSDAVDVDVVAGEDPRRLDLYFRQRQAAPEHWSAAIGDYLHNLRSALDNLTWAVVACHRTRPLLEFEERNVMFPIRTSAEGWDQSIARRLPAVEEPSVLTGFRREQPFAFTEGIPELSARDNEYHPLARLQLMSNSDKHRTTAVVLATPDMVSLGAPDDRVKFRHGDPWPWTDGSLIGSWLLPPDYAEGAVAPGHELVVALAENARPFGASNFVDQLASLGGAVRDTIWRLAPFIGGG